MCAEHFNAPRLFLEAPLSAGARLALERQQAHYLSSVMRLGPGREVLVFNGRDGLWRAAIEADGRRGMALRLCELVRAQSDGPDTHCLFAPLKRARLDYMVQKAVEMGASRLQPVITRHTLAERVNLERMRANAIEAAEQCGILRIPAIGEPAGLPEALAALGPDRLLVFCDEEAPVRDPVAALREAGARLGLPDTRPPSLAVLIGPEGGFSTEERALLLERPGIVRLSLGPRILRADTAAVAALTLVAAVLGDWR